MEVSIRPATPADIGDLTRYQMASYGGYAEVMYDDAVPGLSPRQILEMRFEQDGTTFHFAHGRMAEVGGELAGGAHAYPVDDESDDPPDHFIPRDRLYYFAPLEGLTLPGSYYLNVISVESAFRGQGVGRRLLEHVMGEGREAGFDKISLLAFEANSAAVGLYRSLGFEELKRRPVVPHPALMHEGSILLMAANL
ncbi:MAG: GNAT family N-acetyltransferase [Rhodospirillales bacterium]